MCEDQLWVLLPIKFTIRLVKGLVYALIGGYHWYNEAPWPKQFLIMKSFILLTHLQVAVHQWSKSKLELKQASNLELGPDAEAMEECLLSGFLSIIFSACFLMPAMVTCPCSDHVPQWAGAFHINH